MMQRLEDRVLNHFVMSASHNKAEFNRRGKFYKRFWKDRDIEFCKEQKERDIKETLDSGEEYIEMPLGEYPGLGITNREWADLDIAHRVIGYVARQSPCVSVKFERAYQEKVDQNKFLLPLYKDVPVMAFQVVNALANEGLVSVVGSDEVGMVVDAIKKALPEYSQNVAFSREGDEPKDLKLFKSIQGGRDTAKEQLGLGSEDHFAFVPLDCPFFYDLRPVFNDEEIKKYACLADMNAKELVFPDGEFFPRNYYFNMVNGFDTLSLKEPNLFTFDASIDPQIIQRFYETREAGQMNPLVFVGIVWDNIKDDIADNKGGYARLAKATYSALRAGLLTASYKFITGSKFAATSEDASNLGYYVFNAPFCMRATHTDPWRVKDIDAWHDLTYYHLIIQGAAEKYGSMENGLKVIYPCADMIERVNEEMQIVKGKIGALRDFGGYVNETFDGLRRAFNVQLAREIEISKDPSVLESLSTYELMCPWSLDGRVVVGPSEGEDISRSITYLENLSSKCKPTSL